MRLQLLANAVQRKRQLHVLFHWRGGWSSCVRMHLQSQALYRRLAAGRTPPQRKRQLLLRQ
jgi:hypothetical protein